MNRDICYIIIVNYNSYKDTIVCLHSILSLKDHRYKIIVIDNGSTNHSIERLKEYLTTLSISTNKISLLEINNNKGYGYGINTGIKFALATDDCNYLWVLNNDVRVSNNCLSRLINCCTYDTIVTPSVYDYDKISEVQSLGCKINPITLTTRNILNNINKKIDYISGVSLFFNKSIIDINGLFSEKYFMYYEDVEWCTRATKNKIKLMVLNDCKIFHKSKKNISYKLKVLSHINRIKFCLDHYFYKLPLVLVSVLLSIILTSLKRVILVLK